MITTTTPRRARRRTPLTVLTALAALCAGVSFAGCSSPPNEGTLDGTLQALGGPAGTGPRPLSGSVTFHGSDGNIATIDLPASGRFSAHLPVGRYSVAGRSPQFERGAGECQVPGLVTVSKDATNTVVIDCNASEAPGTSGPSVGPPLSDDAREPPQEQGHRVKM